MTGYASVEGAVEAMKKGASTYLKKPLNISELRAVIEKVVEKQNLSRSNLYLQQELDRKYGFSGIIGNSEAMQRVFTTLQPSLPPARPFSSRAKAAPAGTRRQGDPSQFAPP